MEPNRTNEIPMDYPDNKSQSGKADAESTTTNAKGFQQISDMQQRKFSEQTYNDSSGGMPRPLPAIYGEAPPPSEQPMYSQGGPMPSPHNLSISANTPTLNHLLTNSHPPKYPSASGYGDYQSAPVAPASSQNMYDGWGNSQHAANSSTSAMYSNTMGHMSRPGMPPPNRGPGAPNSLQVTITSSY